MIDLELGFVLVGGCFLFQQLQAKVHAVIADEHAVGPGNEVFDLTARSLAKGAPLFA